MTKREVHAAEARLGQVWGRESVWKTEVIGCSCESCICDKTEANKKPVLLSVREERAKKYATLYLVVR